MELLITFVLKQQHISRETFHITVKQLPLQHPYLKEKVEHLCSTLPIIKTKKISIQKSPQEILPGIHPFY